MNKILPVIALVLLTACGDDIPEEPPISIETYDKQAAYYQKYVEVIVRAKVDEIEIKDIIVNRGNCKINKRGWISREFALPARLQYGSTYSATFVPPCSASQVDVETNQGVWTVNY